MYAGGRPASLTVSNPSQPPMAEGPRNLSFQRSPAQESHLSIYLSRNRQCQLNVYLRQPQEAVHYRVYREISGAVFYRTPGCGRPTPHRHSPEKRLAVGPLTKHRDFEYFLREIAGIEYEHDLGLAHGESSTPTRSKAWNGPRSNASRRYSASEPRPIAALQVGELDRHCLLCSEAEPDHCHRRLVAEYLQEQWPDLAIEHLTLRPADRTPKKSSLRPSKSTSDVLARSN